jgi:signal transduction histidine kinase
MDNLITDLLQYSKVSIQEVVLLPVDLNKIIGKAVFMLNEDINNKKAVIRIKPGLPQVIAFAPAMVIVFTNLISNALKFVDERTIPLISISGSLKGGKAIIRFRDNGIGIPSEKHKLIFEVFEKLHGIESYPGYGIGLAIVKKSLERMGGEVSVLSEVGKGSTFVLKLQAAE